MPRSNTVSPFIEIGRGRSVVRLPVLYEDRSVLAVDKPAGWMLVPYSWQRTRRNLTAALAKTLAARPHWVRVRNLKFLRHVHRLDAETSGVLLLAKSLGGVNSYGDLFESRAMHKVYLAVAYGAPPQTEWTCREPIGRDPSVIGRMRIDKASGKAAETAFRVVSAEGRRCLIEARPVTGRTHQIRLHLKAAGLPIVGDPLYGEETAEEAHRGGEAWESASRSRRRHGASAAFPMGLRAVRLSYQDPFRQVAVDICAETETFLNAFGFAAAAEEWRR